jgi:antitoxin PrlF
MIASRLTSKGKTIIPQPVRAALNLRDGDELQYGLQGDHVVLTKAEPPPEPFAVFDEWHSETDRKAYAKL